MKLKLLVFLCLPLLLPAAEKVIFSESFESPESLKKWREIPVKDGAVFSIKEKSLDVSHGFVEGGAGFIVAIAGKIMLMPGLGAHPAAEKIDLLSDGTIVGLS